jgi:6-phosphogluconolactonase
MKHELSHFETRDAALDFAAKFVAGGLQRAIADRGRADFMTSGGSTPGPLFDRLSELGATVGKCERRSCR